MDKLKLRYLIREAIENVVGVSAKFSVGDKVTTVDGDTAKVTMAEHPFYTVELEATGTTKSFNFKDLAPFQEKEIAKTSEGIMLQEGVTASPGLMFHQTHKRSLSECVFRIGSEAYVDFYAEARELFNEGVLKINELDRDLIQRTDIGEYGIFEGKKVALDIPFINEEYSTLDLHNIARRLKNQGFITKINPARFDKGVYDVTYFAGDIDDLQSALNDIFGRDGYRIVFDESLSEDSDKSKMPTQDQVTKFFTKTQQELHYLSDKPVEDWDEYDLSNWKAKLRKYKEGRPQLSEAKKKEKKDPPLGKPKRGGSKAYYVYVRDPKTKRIKKVSFGSGGLRAKINNPKARKAFAARHKCSQKNDRTKASYWSCRLPRYAKALGLGANKNTFW